MEIIVVAFDPSITCTGYAAMRGYLNEDREPELIEFGTIKPDDKKASSIVRIEQIVADARMVAKRYPDAIFAIEITSGKTSKRHGGGGDGLGTYGMLVGHLARELLNTQPRVRQVYENEWTAGFSKGDRKRTAAIAYPAYREIEQSDTGGDISDAIMLAEWTIRHTNYQPNLDRDGEIVGVGRRASA